MIIDNILNGLHPTLHHMFGIPYNSSIHNGKLNCSFYNIIVVHQVFSLGDCSKGCQGLRDEVYYRERRAHLSIKNGKWCVDP